MKKLVNESVEDILRPKSKEEIDDAFDDVAQRAADLLMDYFDFDDFTDAYDWAINHQEKILEYSSIYDYELSSDIDLRLLLKFILYGPDVEH